ncbi:MAG: ABC transporter permease subunit [Betaproteobacteria bacterium]|nr:ABC transporter permease subunit [Betaproteobacteria bacterium]
MSEESRVRGEGHAIRDPAAMPRLALALLIIALLWPGFRLTEFDLGVLLDPRNRETMGRFVATFFPLATSHEFLQLVLKSTLETLAIATAGMALAMLVAAPLSLAVSRSLSMSRVGPGPGRLAGTAARLPARFVLMFFRSIPEIVWALLFVRAVGLGPAAGVLAIGVTYGGMLGKVYSEILESNDTRPAVALLESGGGRLGAFFYGMFPVALPELVSYTVYRWECAVRASVIMGFVGAGGLGQQMELSMRMLNGGEVSTILLTFLLLVVLADAVSALLRRITQ